jgi:hypothetical protein
LITPLAQPGVTCQKKKERPRNGLIDLVSVPSNFGCYGRTIKRTWSAEYGIDPPGESLALKHADLANVEFRGATIVNNEANRKRVSSQIIVREGEEEKENDV